MQPVEDFPFACLAHSATDGSEDHLKAKEEAGACVSQCIKRLIEVLFGHKNVVDLKQRESRSKNAEAHDEGHRKSEQPVRVVNHLGEFQVKVGGARNHAVKVLGRPEVEAENFLAHLDDLRALLVEVEGGEDAGREVVDDAEPHGHRDEKCKHLLESAAQEDDVEKPRTEDED